MVSQDSIKDIVQSLKTDEKQKNHTYQAVVSRVDKQGVVWVNVAGSEIETPTDAIAAEVKRGDAVTVEWRNNKLYISSNYSDPAVGTTRTEVIERIANNAQYTAETALEDAVVAHEAAESATASAATAGRAASVAQAAAEAAQETANTKRTVFVAQPMPPYHVGDLWVREGDDEIISSLVTDQGFNIVGSDGNLFEAVIKGATVYVCVFARSSGAFIESDWSLAATDNTSVNELREWFWHDATGAHVLGDATGFRNDITSTGMKIVDTETETDVAEFTTDRVMLASGDALLKYVEDGAAFGLEDSHRVVLSKNADDVGYRNDATLSSRSVPPFSVNMPMGFANVTHKQAGAVKYGQAAMYVWGGGGQIAPYYVILTQGDIGSEDMGTSDALDIYAKKLIVNTDNFTVNASGEITSSQISDLEEAAAIARDTEGTLLNLATDNAFVYEWGTSGDWRWRVWGNGFVEAWFSGSVTSATGATVVTAPIYRGTWSLSIPSQIGFASAPHILITNNYEPTNVISINGKATSATAISGNFFRVDNQQATVTLYTRIYAWGVAS